MRTYLIKSEHDVYEDHYKNGEGGYVNYWYDKAEVEAESPKEAIKLYCQNQICRPLNIEDIEAEEDNPNVFLWNWNVNEDACTPSKDEYEKFKQGKKVLYIENATIKVFELVPISLS